MELMQKQRIIKFKNQFGTAIALRGSMNNLAIADELKSMADAVSVEVLAEESNFFERYIAFVSDTKQHLEYFLYLAGEYNRNIKRLEQNLQEKSCF